MLALVKQVRVLLREKERWKPTNGKNIALQYQHVFKGTSTKRKVEEQHHMKFGV
jgi:hypothetical protein